MKNKIYIIGMGPGKEDMMTKEAFAVLEKADVIVGYQVYLDLLGARFHEKELLSTPMRYETERCRLAFEEAKKGKTVAMVCSGDAGFYGMASLMYEIGAKDVVEKILPIVDNFERGLQSVPEDKKDDPFVDGMDKIYKQMMSTLEGIGVKPIEAVGQEFDPNFHNAVMHVEDEELGENVVAEEFQKGYMYRDSVVRHSMVKVAN